MSDDKERDREEEEYNGDDDDERKPQEHLISRSPLTNIYNKKLGVTLVTLKLIHKRYPKIKVYGQLADLVEICQQNIGGYAREHYGEILSATYKEIVREDDNSR